MITADTLREKYLEFFRLKEHKVVASDSLVPKDDPTVLFTPAGMNQFKKQFLGLITDFRRAASSQRCLRTDDLEKVGKTDCHHTFFEMLGNFSFGDYFKKEAIAWAWEFLTQDLLIPPEKLWVSVYKDDTEAYDIWKNDIKVPATKIIKLGDHDNFWPADAKEKGPNGPCGPCSEIFFDLGTGIGCQKPGCTPACGCGRFIEVWNLVFTQFNRKEDGSLEPLPQKNIDTGMGLERITAVMQGVRSNFETDLFVPIIKEIKSHAKHYEAKDLTTVYAVADHIRAIAFSILDGILPSNEARGYVVRKLIRKSVLHLRDLGIKEPFLFKLVPVLAEVMKKPYPQLAKEREHISDIILSEEKNFIATLNSSEKLLKEKNEPVFEMLKNEPKNDGIISASGISSATAGSIAFILYDTHGIPLELTRDFWERQKVKFVGDYNDSIAKSLEEQKQRSKSGSAMQGDVFSVKELDLKDVPETVFVGYDTFKSPVRILKILKGGQEADTVTEGEEAKIILDKTPFYAESGGQVGDMGVLQNDKNVFEVCDTQKNHSVILHLGKVKHGAMHKGDALEARLDSERRLAIMRNHTATHLLQAALRTVLGTHVKQQGSLVAEDRFRFDFTHFKDVTDEELDRVEELVNFYVIQNNPVSKKEMSLEEARQQGALAFFAEKYEDKVRVVSIESISKEFCGGTHLDHTGSIGFFKILHESSIASGVRRIEATTGTTAYKTVKAQEQVLADVSEILKTSGDKVIQELQKKVKQVKEFEKQLGAHKLNTVLSSIDDLIKKAQEIKGIKVIAEKVDGADLDALRKTADLIKQKEPSIVVALGSGDGGRAFLIAATNIAGIDSSALIKQIASEIGGSGGGRKDFAQAGGTKPENLDTALQKFKKLIGMRS